MLVLRVEYLAIFRILFFGWVFSLFHEFDYLEFCAVFGYEPVFVAVRSSATAEDTSKASFAGQQETFLNIKGNTALVEAVKKCWASLFTARSIYYRTKKGFRHEDVLIAVIVQIMINADKSGVIISHFISDSDYRI